MDFQEVADAKESSLGDTRKMGPIMHKYVMIQVSLQIDFTITAVLFIHSSVKSATDCLPNSP